jgi:hypothetical protein
MFSYAWNKLFVCPCPAGNITQFRGVWYGHHTGLGRIKENHSMTSYLNYETAKWNGALQELDLAFEIPAMKDKDTFAPVKRFILYFLFGILVYPTSPC